MSRRNYGKSIIGRQCLRLSFVCFESKLVLDAATKSLAGSMLVSVIWFGILFSQIYN
jgi:hypothetical protein